MRRGAQPKFTQAQKGINALGVAGVVCLSIVVAAAAILVASWSWHGSGPAADFSAGGGSAAPLPLSVDECIGGFERANELQRTEPRWVAAELRWDMDPLLQACSLFIDGLALSAAQCPFDGIEKPRARATELLWKTLVRVWQRAQTAPNPRKQVSSEGAEAAIHFVRNATATMLAVVTPPTDPPGLTAWASLLEGTRPREAAEMYAAAQAAGAPPTAMGSVFMHGCLEKAGDYEKAAAMLRQAIS